ncbi:alkaline phosphatase family protein [Candidatus Poribacteria bacterium]|nr:alkaline phosphatase family protein [Candidatus Poribacteria bacterium]
MKKNIVNRRKILIICIDAGSYDYLSASEIPNITKLAELGFLQQGNSVIPSVTNVNNVSIATGAFPNKHGITTNYYVDRESRKGEFIEDNRFLLSPTLFEEAKTTKFADTTALFVTKKKLLRILEKGADIQVAAEDPPEEFIESIGDVEPIYSIEINWWLLRAVLYSIQKYDPELIYCSTTDWVQHKYPPEHEISQRHLSELDKIIGDIVEQDPEREIYITADHGMLDKTTALDPARILQQGGIQADSIPIIKDRYVVHHGNLGGAAYVFLNDPNDLNEAIKNLINTVGIEEAYSAEEAAQNFNLHPERIGDIFLLADEHTVFGELQVGKETVSIRSHGSRHESYVPIIGYNSPWSKSDFKFNLDIGRLFLESLK